MESDKKTRVQRGLRVAQIRDYLLREKVGSEMIFTKESAEEVTREFGVNNGHIYRTINRLVERGFISKRKKPGEKGLFLTFLSAPSTAKSKEEVRKSAPPNMGITVEQLRATTLERIGELRKQLEVEEDFLRKIDQRLNYLGVTNAH